MLVRPMNSFQTSHGSYVEQHQLVSGVENSPILMPLRIPCRSEIDGAMAPPDHYSSSKLESLPVRLDGYQAGQPWLNPISHISIGKMNPDATTFSPSYSTATQQGSNCHQITYPPHISYDSSQPVPGVSTYLPQSPSSHNPCFYAPTAIAPGTIYVRSPQSSLKNLRFENRGKPPKDTNNIHCQNHSASSAPKESSVRSNKNVTTANS
jgi:hypothetical protein